MKNSMIRMIAVCLCAVLVFGSAHTAVFPARAESVRSSAGAQEETPGTGTDQEVLTTGDQEIETIKAEPVLPENDDSDSEEPENSGQNGAESTDGNASEPGENDSSGENVSEPDGNGSTGENAPEQSGNASAGGSTSDQSGDASAGENSPKQSSTEGSGKDLPDIKDSEGTGSPNQTGTENTEPGKEEAAPEKQTRGETETYVRLKFHVKGGEISGADNAAGYNNLGNGKWSYSPGGAGTYPQYRVSDASGGSSGWIEIKRSPEEDWETYYENVYADEYSHDLPDVSDFGVRRKQYRIDPAQAYNRRSDMSGAYITQTGGTENIANAVTLNDGAAVTQQGLERGVYMNWVSAPALTVIYHVNGGTISAADFTSYPMYGVTSDGKITKKASASANYYTYTDTVYDDGYQYDLLDATGVKAKKTGCTIEAAKAYNTKEDQTGLFLSQGLARATAATAKRINGGAAVTESKKVTLYIAWKSSESVTVQFSTNGVPLAASSGNTYPKYRALSSGQYIVQIQQNASAAWENYTVSIPLSAVNYNLPAIADQTFGAVKEHFHIRRERHYNLKADGSGNWFMDNNADSADENRVTAQRLTGGTAGTVTLYTAWESDDASVEIRLHSNGAAISKKPRGDEPAGKDGMTESGGGTDLIRTFTLTYGESQQFGNMPLNMPNNYLTDHKALTEAVFERNKNVYLTYFFREGYHPAGWTKDSGTQVSFSDGCGKMTFYSEHLHFSSFLPAEDDRYSAVPTISMESIDAYAGDPAVDLYCQWLPDIGITGSSLKESSAGMPGSGGVSFSTTGFKADAPVYRGVNLFIPAVNPGEETELYADGSLEWQTNGSKYILTRKGTVPRKLEYDTVSGSAYIILKNRAYDIHSSAYDVKLTFSGIRGNSGDNSAGKMVYFTYYTDSAGCYLDAYGDTGLTTRAGRSVDVKLEILDENGNPVTTLAEEPGTSMVTTLFFHDIDIPDRLIAPGNLENRYKWQSVDTSGGKSRAYGIAPYAEAVALPPESLALAGNTIYVNPPMRGGDGANGNRMVYEVLDDGGLKLTGSWYSGVESTNTGQNPMIDTYDEGFMVRTELSETGGFFFTHTGAGCGTVLFETPDPYQIRTNVVEDNGESPGPKINGGAGSPEIGIITRGGEEAADYPQGARGSFTFSPGPAYEVSGLWIDGVRVNDAHFDGNAHTGELRGLDNSSEPWVPVSGGTNVTQVSYQAERISGGTVIFSDIHSNHTVDVAYRLRKHSITVGKCIEFPYEAETVDADGVRWKTHRSYGEATFIFVLKGTSTVGEKIELTRMVTVDDVTKETSFTWEDLPAGEYTLAEMTVSRYRQETIEGSENVEKEEEHAVIDLTADDAEVTFTNCLEQYEKVSHNASAVNRLNAKRS